MEGNRLSSKIHIGYELQTGKPIAIAVTHTFIGGTTGTGKSELLRALIERVDAKILVLDVKRPRDYKGFGADTSLYIEQRMEAMTLKDLLESTERISIKRELPELSRLCRKSKMWEELLANAREKQANPKTRDFYKDVLEVLIVLFERLVTEFNRYSFADKVELPNKVNVMDLSELSDQLQQVVVSSVLRYILRKRKNVIVVVDEAHRFVPQAQASAARYDVINLIREGRAKKVFLWLADQTVTGIDKQLMKQMQIWCLGRQMELNEAERTLKQIPQRKSLGLNVEAVQTLGLGEFIVFSEKWAHHVYVQPTWVQDDLAIQVAKGHLDAEQLVKPTEVDEEMEWRKRATELEKQLIIERRKTTEQEDEIQKLHQQNHELQQSIKALETKLQNIQRDVDPQPENTPQAAHTTPVFRAFSNSKLLQLIDQRLDQRILEEKRIVHIPLEQAIREKIMTAWMDRHASAFTTMSDYAKQAARFIHKKGQATHKELYFHIRHKSSGTDVSFSRDYINPLIKLEIIEKMGRGGSVTYRWALDDQILAQFEGLLNEKEIQEVRDWLLSIIL